MHLCRLAPISNSKHTAYVLLHLCNTDLTLSLLALYDYRFKFYAELTILLDPTTTEARPFVSSAQWSSPQKSAQSFATSNTLLIISYNAVCIATLVQCLTWIIHRWGTILVRVLKSWLRWLLVQVSAVVAINTSSAWIKSTRCRPLAGMPWPWHRGSHSIIFWLTKNAAIWAITGSSGSKTSVKKNTVRDSPASVLNEFLACVRTAFCALWVSRARKVKVCFCFELLVGQLAPGVVLAFKTNVSTRHAVASLNKWKITFVISQFHCRVRLKSHWKFGCENSVNERLDHVQCGYRLLELT